MSLDLARLKEDIDESNVSNKFYGGVHLQAIDEIFKLVEKSSSLLETCKFDVQVLGICRCKCCRRISSIFINRF